MEAVERRVSRSSTSSVPTCTHCKVPMNLCHCSKSSCSSCALPSGECSCARAAIRPRTPAACQRCAELELLLKQASQQAAAQQRDVAEARKALAATQQTAQIDREGKAVAVGKAHSLERELVALSQQMQMQAKQQQQQQHAQRPEISEEELKQLRQQLTAATEARTVVEMARRTAVQQLSRVKEEIVEARRHVQDAQEKARLAEEGRLEYIAEVEAAAEKERKMRAALAAAEAERDVLRHDGMAAATLRDQLAAEKAARRAVEEKLKELTPTVVERENAKYEELRSENRMLVAMLAESDDECKRSAARAKRIEALEARVEALLQERGKLVQEAEHAAHVRKLFATVTSRTNEVQQVAQSVIEAVEARKRAVGGGKHGAVGEVNAEGERQALREITPAETGAAGGGSGWGAGGWVATG